MLWVISGGLVLVNAAIWIVLLRLLWRERGEKWHWRQEACLQLERCNAFVRADRDAREHRARLYDKVLEEKNQLRERAEKAESEAASFEAAGKTLEEHVAAERGRADRLAEALQDSEDRCEQLQAELNELRRAASEPPADKEAPAFTAAIDARELANVMNYNGTAEGQVDLNDE